MCCCYSTTDDKASVASLGSSRLPAICVHSCSTKRFNLMLYYLLLHLSRQCVMLQSIPADRQAENRTGLRSSLPLPPPPPRTVLFSPASFSLLLHMKDMATVPERRKKRQLSFHQEKKQHRLISHTANCCQGLGGQNKL